MVKTKHKPPSRIRYEKANPTVSIRVSKELYQRLDEIRQMSGKSFADILRDGATSSVPLIKESYE